MAYRSTARAFVPSIAAATCTEGTLPSLGSLLHRLSRPFSPRITPRKRDHSTRNPVERPASGTLRLVSSTPIGVRRLIPRLSLPISQRSVEQPMASLRLYDPEFSYPTHAEILQFGKNPRFYLPGAYVPRMYSLFGYQQQPSQTVAPQDRYG